MDISQLRTSFLEALKGSASRALSNQFLEAIQRNAVNLGYMEPQQLLQHQDRDKVFEVFWSFVNEGLLIPGVNLDNLNLPAFTVTEHGLSVLNSDDPTPHDPDRYLQRLKQVAPRVDDVAMFYVEEGLKCFQRGTYTAAVMMLGVSAERITLKFAGSMAVSAPNTSILYPYRMALREGRTVLGNELILALLVCNSFRGRRAQAVRHARQVIWPDVLFHIGYQPDSRLRPSQGHLGGSKPSVGVARSPGINPSVW